MPENERKRKKYKNPPENVVVDNEVERPISTIYPVIDTDLARDNLENDLPASELQDL